MYILIDKGVDSEHPYWAYTVDAPEQQFHGYGETPEEALADLKKEMQKVITRELWDLSTDPPRYNDNLSETCTYLLNTPFSVYMMTDYDFCLDFENPPKDLKEILDTLD